MLLNPLEKAFAKSRQAFSQRIDDGTAAVLSQPSATFVDLEASPFEVVCWVVEIV